jgi:glucosylglycerate phosphorylase
MRPASTHKLEARLLTRLQRIYGETQGTQTHARLLALPALRELRAAAPPKDGRRAGDFTERDALLISYGDSLRRQDLTPLAALGDFARRRLPGVFSTIHLLPFFPFSSDDGFSVIDFLQVDPDLGGWDDVAALSQEFALAFDLVLNHVSSQSGWFADYLAERAPFSNLAIAMDPTADLSAVTRPRALPLLTPYVKESGERVHLWTTFSADQIDLNYADPDVLLQMVQVVLAYATRGASVLRLDAVAYLWKEPGSSCIHLPLTHEVVRLLRDLLDLAAPQVTLLTETNVPHAENVSYFGAPGEEGGAEAQLIYNFSLPPLTLHALLTGDASLLSRWAATLEAPAPHTTFLNFTASHDGVGVRPLEGLLPPGEVEDLLCQRTRDCGGSVAYRDLPDGGRSPYELNATYVDLLRLGDDDPLHVERFLASQAVALALPGVPAVYVGSLLGSGNWTEGVEQTGRARTINRQKLDLEALEPELDDGAGRRGQVFTRLAELLRRRAAQPAFHPAAPCRVLQLHPGCLALERRAHSGGQLLLALTNVCDQELTLTPPDAGPWRDLLGQTAVRDGRLRLPPYGVAWLERG